ncbi:MAG: hypothetical protein PVI26_01250 [Chitinispirillia bacterium]
MFFIHFDEDLFADFGKGWESAFPALQARLKDSALTGKLVEGLVASHLRITGSHKLSYLPHFPGS